MLTPEQVQEIQKRYYPFAHDFRIESDFEIAYTRYDADGKFYMTIEVQEIPYPIADLIRSWGYALPIF